MVDCSYCGGTGEVSYDENGRRVTDVCYHCSATGLVDEETNLKDEEEAHLLSRAEQMVQEQWDKAQEEPYFDGWGLIAAESMLSEWELFQSMVYDQFDELLKEANREL